jgi:hypothetical protein
MIDAILNTSNINIIMRIVYNMKYYYKFGKKTRRGETNEHDLLKVLANCPS